MKKFILPALVLVLAGTSAQAQTKRIAHRSHSGADRHFSLSGTDNFGNPPEDWKNRHVPVMDTAKAGTNGAKTTDKTEKPARTRKFKKASSKKTSAAVGPK